MGIEIKTECVGNITINSNSTPEELKRAIYALFMEYDPDTSDIELVKWLLDRTEMDLNLVSIYNGGGKTLLHWAASNGWTEAMEILLDRGANVNMMSSGGGTPLMEAAYTGKTEACRILIDRGAIVHIAEPNCGRTALHMTTRWGSVDTARLLLDRGAKVDVPSMRGDTPLRELTDFIGTPSPALSAKHRDLAKLLILRGADPARAFKGPGEIIKFFGGDVGWWPEEGLKAKLIRTHKVKGIFGK